MVTKIVASLVLLLSVFAISCGGARTEEVSSSGTVTTTGTPYPPRLQEIVDKAEEKMAQSGLGWISVFHNDFVDITYSRPNPTDEPSFVVSVYEAGDPAKAEGIVKDFFGGLGVVDITTLNIGFRFVPE